MSPQVGALDLLQAIGAFFRVSIGSVVVGLLLGFASGWATKQLTKGRALDEKAKAESTEGRTVESEAEPHFEVSVSTRVV